MKQIFVFLYVLLGVCAQAQGTFGNSRRPQLHAVIAGVSRYQYAHASLKYAHRDAEAIHKLLVYTSGVQTDPAARLLLLDSLATAGNFNEGIKQITKKVASGAIAAGDYIVIYFSGHGMLENGTGENNGCFLM